MKSNTLLPIAAVIVAAGACLAVPAGAAPRTTGSVTYAVAQSVCGTPRPGEKACFAVKLVPAAKGTPGARPMATPAALGGPRGGFAPDDLAAAYGYDRTAATTMTVAIVDAYDDPKAKADLNAYDANYGLPAETASSFRKVNQAGQTGPLPNPDAGWAVEIALDVQAVRAVCNKCKILLVEANSPSSFDLARAVNAAARLGADVISNSYGGPEQPAEPVWVGKAYDHPGVVITASTGDDGWYSWDRANNGSSGWSYNKPNTPSAYPTVVAVTGTKLTVNGDGSRAQETVWNANGPHDKYGLRNSIFRGAQGASGGGCSARYAAPTWQAAVAGYGNTGCHSQRMVGDVAAVADPVTGFDVFDSYRQSGPNFWMRVGGTSLSSPIIAAMWALAGGAGAEKYPAKSLYDRLLYTPTDIADVTIGSNAFCGGDSKPTCSAAVQAQVPQTGNPNNLTNGNQRYRQGWAGLLDCGYVRNGGEGTVAADKQCNARAGFDGPSGVGAPAGLTLFQPTKITVTILGPAAPQLNTSQSWSAINFSDGIDGATPVSDLWRWGDGSPTDPNASTTHTFSQAGTYRVMLTVTDSYGQTGRATRTITVGMPPTAVISGPTTVHRGQAATWRSGHSAATNTGATLVSRTWYIGAQQVATSSSLTRTFNHTGSHTIKLKVVDSTGLTGTKSITVTVIR